MSLIKIFLSKINRLLMFTGISCGFIGACIIGFYRGLADLFGIAVFWLGVYCVARSLED